MGEYADETLDREMNEWIEEILPPFSDEKVCPKLKRNLTSRSSRAADVCVLWPSCDYGTLDVCKACSRYQPPPA